MKKVWSLCLLLVFLACSKDDQDDTNINLVDKSDSETSLNLELSDFIWKGLNQYYYWQKDVPKLDDALTLDRNEYAQFIKDNPEPEAFFESLLFSGDRFSWIVDDYLELQNSFQGIVASNGMEFSLFRIEEGSNDLIGWVKFIHKGSDAEEKEVERGDLFTQVNGQQITVDNYRDLLFSDLLTYTISLADYNNGQYNLNGENIELVKEENFQKDPIVAQSVIVAEDTRIGYLMYNQFASSFDEQLNEVFASFRNEAIDELVLDLRYNRGGSIRSCTYLASLITGQFSNEIFAQEIWNDKLMDYFRQNDEERLYNRFTNQISGGNALNSLQLNRVYILTTDESASASELLINGLKPYIQVVQIGETTVGKNVGSITVYDYIDNEGTKNPNHLYAMQPIVLAIANSEGFADYSQGLSPDITLSEDRKNAGVLGDENETLFAAAIREIVGTGKGRSYYVSPFGPKIQDPEMQAEQRLLIDSKKLPKRINVPSENQP
ncbi:MAG: S41 family peptidase [Flavobacteriaceae bacterium]|nr:S41 family peptidase [Flavobacteriaceae bacterium]